MSVSVIARRLSSFLFFSFSFNFKFHLKLFFFVLFYYILYYNFFQSYLSTLFSPFPVLFFFNASRLEVAYAFVAHWAVSPYSFVFYSVRPSTKICVRRTAFLTAFPVQSGGNNNASRRKSKNRRNDERQRLQIEASHISHLVYVKAWFAKQNQRKPSWTNGGWLVELTLGHTGFIPEGDSPDLGCTWWTSRIRDGRMLCIVSSYDGWLS